MHNPIPSAALNQHVAILGKTGSGKTYAAKGIVEHLLGEDRQVCVLDPTSAWWGLRLAADGKGRGFDVVLLGGDHADIPLAERSGAAVARLVTEQHASVVIDTGGMTVGQYTRWFIDFAGTLYTTIKAPLHLVIDEAHHFMPQGKVPDPDTGRMLHAGNRLMSGGRSRGIRGMLITQRPQKLHKDALTCADTLVAMRVTAPHDRKAYQDWIDGCGDPVQGKAVLETLARLQKGEGWIWYPEGDYLKRVSFPQIKTYDSSAAPAHGAKAGPKVAEINLGEVKQALAEAVKEAEANDPKLLRQRIAELERQVKAAKPAPADPMAIEREVRRTIGEERQQHVKEVNARDRIIKTLTGKMDRGAKAATDLATMLHVNGEVSEIPRAPSISSAGESRTLTDRRGGLPGPVTALAAEASPAVRTLRARTRNAPGSRTESPALAESQLPRGERAVLTALIQFPEGRHRKQLTVLTGYKRSSRDAYIARLREKGLIEAIGDSCRATEAGVAALPDAEPLPTGEDLQRYWLDRLPQGERVILEQLIAAYPEDVDKESLGEAAGYQRSSRDAYLQRMRAKQLIEEPSRGAVRASENLF